MTLAANGAKTVKGGNRQIFERFIRDSGATVSLNTRVGSACTSLRGLSKH